MFCRHSAFLLVILFFFGSCANKPKEILSMSEMTDILVDLNKAEALFELDQFRNDISEEEQYRYRLGILEKHNSNQAQLDSSLVWYNRDPKKLDKIFFRVLGQLEEQKEYILKNPITSWRVTVAKEDLRDFVWFKQYLRQLSSPAELYFTPYKYSIEFSSDSLWRRFDSPSVYYDKIKEKEREENRLWLEMEFQRIYSSNGLEFELLTLSPFEYSTTILQKYVPQPIVIEQADDPVLKSIKTPKPLMIP